MMPFLKSIGLEVLLYGTLVVLFFMFLLGLRKSGKEQGRIEQAIKNIRDQQETLKRARMAKKEFGINIEDLEHDDNNQYGKKPYGNVEGDGIVSDPERLQFHDSPFHRD